MDFNADVIAGFSASLLQKNFDQPVAVPQCHYDWWEACASNHPKVAIAAPRRHAKSTAVTLAYALACICFRKSSYMLIVSDTITQACQFLGELKKELIENEQLKTLFKIGKYEKDTEDDFIVSFMDGPKFRISAKGSEQKLRGLKWDNKRPDLIIGDDLENDEIVMNPERRMKFKRWFYGALVPCLSKNGKIRIVGTILHEDSLLSNLMPTPWHRETVTTPLLTYSKLVRPTWKAFKYRAHNEDYSLILWPANYTKDYFVHLRADFVARGLPDVYSQEILNEPIDESVAYFKKADFTLMKDEHAEENMHFYIAADLAISKEQTADWCVFVVVGVDSGKKINVVDVVRQRLDSKEIVDMVINLQRTYDPELFGIEETQITKSIGPYLREEMVRTGVFPNLLALKHQGKDKIARARSIQGRCRAHAVRFDKEAEWYPAFEEELTKFPRGRHDDQVDAFAYIGMMLDSLIEAPTQQEMEEDEYEEELRVSGHDHRNKHTGY